MFRYYLNADVEECVDSPEVCGSGRCVNVPGGYHCNCTGGMVPTPDQRGCIGKLLLLLLHSFIQTFEVMKKFVNSL